MGHHHLPGRAGPAPAGAFAAAAPPLLAAGLLALIGSFGGTLRAARSWNATTAGIGLALATLALQVGAGIALTLNRRLGFWPGLGLNGAAGHALLGLIGWFSLLTVALSYRLVGMFTLAHGYASRFQAPALGGLA
ncbi:MAG TPA: hypothetical protein VD886_08960 [Herpetosiphonaceae bacterium]|nr:hypothetical protein [Herpetosiphonaceae bacterium]